MKWFASDFLTESKECVFWLWECPALTGYLAVNIQEGMEGNCEVFIQPRHSVDTSYRLSFWDSYPLEMSIEWKADLYTSSSKPFLSFASINLKWNTKIRFRQSNWFVGYFLRPLVIPKKAQVRWLRALHKPFEWHEGSKCQYTTKEISMISHS